MRTGELVLDNVTSELAKWSYRCDVFNAQLRQRVTSNYVTIQLEGDGSGSSPSLLWASPSPSRVIAGDQVTLTCYFSVSTAVYVIAACYNLNQNLSMLGHKQYLYVV